jgi:hypothetical protein
VRWLALAEFGEFSACLQNHLGRLTGMDAATIKASSTA